MVGRWRFTARSPATRDHRRPCASFPLDGGQPRTLWQTGSQLVGSGLSWSPDGRQLALSVRPSIGQPLRIMLLDVSTLTRQWLTDPDSVGGDALPAFSPDGASLAFVRSAGAESALHVVQLETGRGPAPGCRST